MFIHFVRPVSHSARLARRLAQLAFFAVTNRQLYGHVEYAGALDQLASIANEFKPGDVVLTLGAGDVWQVAEGLLREK